MGGESAAIRLHACSHAYIHASFAPFFVSCTRPVCGWRPSEYGGTSRQFTLHRFVSGVKLSDGNAWVNEIKFPLIIFSNLLSSVCLVAFAVVVAVRLLSAVLRSWLLSVCPYF